MRQVVNTVRSRRVIRFSGISYAPNGFKYVFHVTQKGLSPETETVECDSPEGDPLRSFSPLQRRSGAQRADAVERGVVIIEVPLVAESVLRDAEALGEPLIMDDFSCA